LFSVSKLFFSPDSDENPEEPPEETLIGCSLYLQQEEYGNCFADNAAYWNSLLFPNLDVAKLRDDITACLQRKGFNVPIGKPGKVGIPPARLNEAIDCKIEGVGGQGGKEKIKTRERGERGNTNPFVSNCPSIGTRILLTVGPNSPGSSGGGHATQCTITYCNPNTGQTTMDCKENPNTPAPSAGATFTLTVASNGGVSTNPPSSLNGGVVNSFSTAT